jgi:hypothetical protein
VFFLVCGGIEDLPATVVNVRPGTIVQTAWLASAIDESAGLGDDGSARSWNQDHLADVAAFGDTRVCGGGFGEWVH